MACLFFSASSSRFLFSSASLAFLSASSPASTAPSFSTVASNNLTPVARKLSNGALAALDSPSCDANSILSSLANVSLHQSVLKLEAAKTCSSSHDAEASADNSLKNCGDLVSLADDVEVSNDCNNNGGSSCGNVETDGGSNINTHSPPVEEAAALLTTEI